MNAEEVPVVEVVPIDTETSKKQPPPPPTSVSPPPPSAPAVAATPAPPPAEPVKRESSLSSFLFLFSQPGIDLSECICNPAVW